MIGRIKAWRDRRRQRRETEYWRWCRDCSGYQHAIHDLETFAARGSISHRAVELARMAYDQHRLNTHPAFADEQFHAAFAAECDRARQHQRETDR